MRRLSYLTIILVPDLISPSSFAQDKIEVQITYLSQKADRLPPPSLLDPIETPKGKFAGARLGPETNLTTRSFLATTIS